MEPERDRDSGETLQARGTANKGLRLLFKLSNSMDYVAVLALTFLMTLTVLDVIGRSAGKPIPGTFEIVGLTGAIVIGFALPLSSWKRSHVCLDYLLEKMTGRNRNVLLVTTRIVGMLLFLLFGISLLSLAKETYLSGEVSLTIKLPTYLFITTTALCCFVESIVLLGDCIRIIGESHE